MDILRLNGLQFFGHHGTEAWEKETGRRFVVDLELSMDMTRAGTNDDLKAALDYRNVHAAARRVVEDERHDLIERVAWRLLESMFELWRGIETVRVVVHKPEAPIGGLNTDVQADIRRTRQEFERLR